ncbi:hypothetical protein [Spirillospora sp. CA-294931]|uniref:hypothetical protein n=1 Tax=Spirillospora sp. CA-294931 TaxID=3240042 RepID=UPI003D8CF9D0
MDQRTRERPTLIWTAEGRLRDARIGLAALRAAEGGEPFAVLGETFVKGSRNNRLDSNGSTCAFDESGRRRNLVLDEHRAFWGWAAIEFLRHTGVRIKEMLETSQHSITQYTLATTGKLFPLLQVAPSKTDEQRLLVVSPELADVLSAAVTRIRGADGAVPLLPFYTSQHGGTRSFPRGRPRVHSFAHGGSGGRRGAADINHQSGAQR